MAKIPETGKVTIADIATEFQGPKDLAELSKKPPLNMSGTEQVGIDDFRGKELTLFADAEGGTVTTDGDYKIHTFTGNAAFDLTSVGAGTGNDAAEVLIIAGGGGAEQYSGGAGAGGMVQTSLSLANARSFAVVVGAGGSGGQGIDSSFETLTVAKGGARSGEYATNPGIAGGSGSGSGAGNNGTPTGGAGTAGQGSNGGKGGAYQSSGGGGGAGGSGGNCSGYDEQNGLYKGVGGNGGSGKAASINGVMYCGGGGGNTGRDPAQNNMDNGSKGGNAGSGGGGRGGHNGERNTSARVFDATNYGGGAGAGGNGIINGYQGIVIVKYKYKDDGISLKSDQTIFDHAPAIEDSPDYNPETHKAVLNMIDDPTQETVGWTVVKMTDEEKAAYLAAQGDKE